MIESDLARQAARLLAVEWMPGVEPNFIRAFSNYVYLLPAGSERLFLRITSALHRSLAELHSELEFIQFLRSRGLSVSEPVPSLTGELVHTVEVGKEAFHASVFREAPGVEFTDLSPSARRKFLRLAGQTMGRLHEATRGFLPSKDFQRFQWSEDRWTHFSTLIPERECEARRLYQDLQGWIANLPRDPSVYGMIHGDFTILNMRILPDRITVFDFDSCCEHWYGYELATFLHYFGGQDETARRQIYDDVLGGYAEATDLDNRMLATIPLFGKMRLLYSFLVFAEEWGFENLSSDQTQYFALRRRLFTEKPAWPPRVYGSGSDSAGNHVHR